MAHLLEPTCVCHFGDYALLRFTSTLRTFGLIVLIVSKEMSFKVI